MKLITCVIRPDRLPVVKEALFRAGVTGITITRASGHGGEADTVTVRRGTAPSATERSSSSRSTASCAFAPASATTPR
jgi:nitrogen regulatory protein PII